ncbi:hypothetical protein GCM10023156_49970 [Novipirellula rosea]|uniref:Secreted protein n=2 Tax=Novipirellula rosea TaxID=1031540 RepID=A0ABP8NEN0_9BACT
MILSRTWLSVPTILWAFTLCELFLPIQGMAQTASVVKLVDDSELPSGDGLAAKFTNDSQLNQHAAVIFTDDFEDGELGAKWDETNDRTGDALSFDDPASKSPMLGRRSLKVTATLGQNSGGGFTKWFESSDRLFIRFYTKFDKNCDYVHHFCTLRANKSLQGGDRWSGFGGAGELPDGDERFSTAIEPWGNWGKWSPPGQWNFYSYWHTMQPSPDGKYWGNGFRPETQPNIERGKWICVEFMLQHNTPGQDDGEQAYWIDGELRGHWRGIQWRTSPTLMANAFTLESYVTDRWTKQRVNIVYFDNVVIAKQYIGPLNKP